MLRVMPLVILAGCTISANGNHRVVGTVDAPIAEANALQQVTVVNLAGTISVRDAGDAGASIRADVLLSEDRPETDFEPDFARHVEVSREGDHLKIRNRHADQADHNDWQLRFELLLPAGVALDIEQVAGTVDVQLPRARDVAIDNTAGTIDLSIPAIEGRLTATAQTGTIDLAVADSGPTEGCEVDCTAGTITVRLPDEVHGDFDLGATAGNVDVDERYGLDIERSVTSVRAKGTVGQGGRRFRVHTVTGNVELR